MPTTEQLAAALRDVLPYAYSHAHTLLLRPSEQALADQRCRAAADLLVALSEPAVDMPPVMAKARKVEPDAETRMRDTLRAYANQSIGPDWTAEQAIAWIKGDARELLAQLGG